MRFGRRKSGPEDAEQPTDTGPDAGSVADGPFDAGDVDPDGPANPLVDLGGLRVGGAEGIELRLQADQATGAVTSVMLADPTGAVELRAFAAPKSGGLWDELRPELVAEAARLGGTADELPGAAPGSDPGPAALPQLRLRVPVKSVDGRSGTQVSRVSAYEGPRWLLRATFLGAAVEAGPDSPLERAVRAVVVVRGDEPMSPRQQLALRLPPDARTGPAPVRTIDP